MATEESKSAAAGAGRGAGAGVDPLITLLSKTTVESFPFEGKVVEIDASASLIEAFKAMVNNRISSAPVYDSESKTYVGFVALPDLVKVVTDAAGTADLSTVTDIHSLDDAVEVDLSASVATAVNVSHSTPFLPVKPSATLLEVARILGNSLAGGVSVHRVPVVGADGRIVKIIAQSRMIRFLADNAPKDSPLLAKTVLDYKLGEGRKVITVGSSEPALKAFRLLLEHRISCVGVVDDEADVGALLGQISGSDILPLAGTGKFDLIALPALDFITTVRGIMDVVERKGSARPAAIKVSRSFTLSKVLDRLAKSRVHRVFLTSPDHKVTGIISLKDILRALVGK